MIISPIVGTAKIVGMNYRGCLTIVTGAGRNYVIIAGYQRIMDVK
jgi:hypothetical protein